MAAPQIIVAMGMPVAMMFPGPRKANRCTLLKPKGSICMAIVPRKRQLSALMKPHKRQLSALKSTKRSLGTRKRREQRIIVSHDGTHARLAPRRNAWGCTKNTKARKTLFALHGSQRHQPSRRGQNH